ncbi:uncharacterized protein METZ01_LOCUS474252, partial [marine metagenome]
MIIARKTGLFAKPGLGQVDYLATGTQEPVNRSPKIRS